MNSSYNYAKYAMVAFLTIFFSSTPLESPQLCSIMHAGNGYICLAGFSPVVAKLTLSIQVNVSLLRTNLA